MPIQAEPDGTLDVENATLRSRNIVSLTSMVAGNDVVRDTAAPTLEVYGDPSNDGGVLPTFELVSNVDATGSAFTRLTSNAGVFTIQSGTDGTADSKGDIAFSSIGGTTERMRIQGSTGNVGIGTDDPGYKLHVEDGSNPRIMLENTDTVLNLNQDIGSILFKQNDSNSPATGIIGKIRMSSVIAPDRATFYGESANMIFSVGNFANDDANIDALTIRGNGNVGIGTDDPAQKLDVGGYAKFGNTSIKTGGPFGSGTGGVYTGISLNGGTGGGTVLFFVSINSSSADASASWIFAIRKYYSGAESRYPWPAYATVLSSGGPQTPSITLYTDSGGILKYTFGQNRNTKWSAYEI